MVHKISFFHRKQLTTDSEAKGDVELARINKSFADISDCESGKGFRPPMRFSRSKKYSKMSEAQRNIGVGFNSLLSRTKVRDHMPDDLETSLSYLKCLACCKDGLSGHVSCWYSGVSSPRACTLEDPERVQAVGAEKSIHICLNTELAEASQAEIIDPFILPGSVPVPSYYVLDALEASLS